MGYEMCQPPLLKFLKNIGNEMLHIKITVFNYWARILKPFEKILIQSEIILKYPSKITSFDQMSFLSYLKGLSTKKKSSEYFFLTGSHSQLLRDFEKFSLVCF